ncbi:hypothetical protein D9758_003599 [Tetrapyrgos nigripes]|uniref:Uncharacterized protein n=1 Tax=Tetrapyrgos nigripes TaxID=182062 RepID=A0A8H5LVZ5_9AGAR|nr:hypothetical protein D9758_003599 [Tetrapyrgos nigripes]
MATTMIISPRPQKAPNYGNILTDLQNLAIIISEKVVSDDERQDVSLSSLTYSSDCGESLSSSSQAQIPVEDRHVSLSDDDTSIRASIPDSDTSSPSSIRARGSLPSPNHLTEVPFPPSVHTLHLGDHTLTLTGSSRATIVPCKLEEADVILFLPPPLPNGKPVKGLMLLGKHVKNLQCHPHCIVPGGKFIPYRVSRLRGPCPHYKHLH